MTIMTVLDTMRGYMKEQLSDYLVYDKDMKAYPVNVFSGSLPRKNMETHGTSYYPMVLILVLGGKDEIGTSSLKVRILTVVNDESLGDGCREIYNLSEKVRQILLKSTIIGGCVTVNSPLEWENSVDTNWPIWQAWVDFTVDIKQDPATLGDWYEQRRPHYGN